MSLFRRGDLPEAPPKELAAKGLAPGFHTQTMAPADVDRFCRAWGVNANDQFNHKTIQACVVPGLKAVILPPEDAPGMDPEKYAAIRAHEFGHSHGVPHYAGGKGWDLSNSPLAGQFAATRRMFGAR